jgi:(2Fe-2S) ferredoxin
LGEGEVFRYSSRVIEPFVRDSAEAKRAGPDRFVVVCRGPNCRARGGLELRQRLVRLLRHEPKTRLVGYACFGQCDFGPNVAFFPEGKWYGGLSAADAAEWVVRHAADATAAPGGHELSLPEAELRDHTQNIRELIAMLERDRLRSRRWWWPF